MNEKVEIYEGGRRVNEKQERGRGEKVARRMMEERGERDAGSGAR